MYKIVWNYYSRGNEIYHIYDGYIANYCLSFKHHDKIKKILFLKGIKLEDMTVKEIDKNTYNLLKKYIHSYV
jgi:hypothetical protein